MWSQAFCASRAGRGAPWPERARVEAQRTTGIVAIVVLLALIVVAGAAAVKGGIGARLTAGFAIVFGIACAG